MKLVFVNNFAHEYLGGGEVQLLMLTEEFLSQGHEVTIVCSQDSRLVREVEKTGATVAETTFSAKGIQSTLRDISVASSGADVLNGTGYYTGLLVRFASLDAGTRIVNIHRTMADAADADGGNSSVRNMLDRYRRSVVDRHIAVSRAVAQSFARIGIPEEEISVIYDGVPPLSSTRPLDRSVRTFGFIGRLERIKGADLFLRAAARVVRENPEARFLVAGDGSQRQSLMELADNLGIADRCEFLGYQDPRKFLPMIDVLVIPSRSEAFSLSAIEAQMARLFIVASDTGGLPEVLLGETTSLLVHPEDIDGFAKAMCAFLSEGVGDIDALKTVSEDVQRTFSPEKTAKAYLELYRGLLNN